MLRPTYEVKTVPVYKKQYGYSSKEEIERYDFEITVRGDFDAEDVKEIDSKFPGAKFIVQKYESTDEFAKRINLRNDFKIDGNANDVSSPLVKWN